MKRDECGGTLHEIPMREAPQRGKCYILISTVTLCSSHNSPEGHIIERVRYKHTAQCSDTDNPRAAGMQAQAGEWTSIGGMPPQQAGTRMGTEEKGQCCHTLSQCQVEVWREGAVLSVSPVCWHAVCIFGHSGGQRKACVHDSDTVVTQFMSGWVNCSLRKSLVWCTQRKVLNRH